MTDRVVDQGVDSLLHDALLVTENHVWRLDVDQFLETVVTVDHATVEVVEVR